LPDVTTRITLRGLDAKLEIFRDEYGIPHVKASSSHDAFFGQGFVTAQDRLWQMDSERHKAYGRYAEWVGHQALDQDKLMRRLRLKASSKADYDSLGSDSKTMLHSYSEGVNAFIQSTNQLPLEYEILGTQPELWEPGDCLAIFRLQHIFMGTYEAKLWRTQLINKVTPEQVAHLFPMPAKELIIMPPQALSSREHLPPIDLNVARASWLSWLYSDSSQRPLGDGSNSWVLDGTRTKHGRPILAGDAHRNLEVPNPYHQSHLACSQFDAIGVSFPGVPGFSHFGHNKSVAWCVTHAYADTQDLYIEQFKKDDPNLYLYQNSWRQMENYQEVIHIRGGGLVDLTVSVTHHGPIIEKDPYGRFGVALHTVHNTPKPWAQGILLELYSQSTKDLEDAFKEWGDPVQNLLFADIHGNTGYLLRGHLPIRSPLNAWIAVPGWTGQHEWREQVPTSDMPSRSKAHRGFMVTANNRVADQNYPHYIALEFPSDSRARRITQHLEKLTNASVADMAAIHMDCNSLPAKAFTEHLSAIQGLTGFPEQARLLLLAWDGTMHPEMVAPTIYSTLRDELVAQIAKHLLGKQAWKALHGLTPGALGYLSILRGRLVDMMNADDRTLLPPGMTWTSALSRALSDAVMKLYRRLGHNKDAWQWGRVHMARPKHPLSMAWAHLSGRLDPPKTALGGDSDTIMATSYALPEPFTVTTSAVLRYAFDLSNWDRSMWSVPLGASGHPDSIHYTDQLHAWASVHMVPMHYNWKTIEMATETHQVLEPSTHKSPEPLTNI
jgi:penicillin amidase